MSIALEQARANQRAGQYAGKVIVGARLEIVKPFQTGFAFAAGILVASLIPAAMGLLVALLAAASVPGVGP